MQDIDFLPADYVCLRETPPSNSGPCVWLVVAVTLIATSWGTMTCVTNQLVARRNELHRQSRDLHAKLGLSQTLLHEWTAVEHEERLIGLLRLQAAPSRWLSAIRQAMPPQLSLSEIGSTFAGESETKPLSRPLEANSIDHGERSPLEQDLGVCPDTRRVGTAHHNRSLMVGSAHPTEGMAFDFPDRHLERLARLAQRHSQVISLRGTTADDQAVSGFVGALQRSGLFERVELLVENHAQRRDATPRAFTIQLRVSPIPDRLNPPPPATTDPEKSTVAQAIRP